MAKGMGGTGEGFDAPSAGRAGAKGFGGHNVSASDLRGAMVKVSFGGYRKRGNLYAAVP